MNPFEFEVSNILQSYGEKPALDGVSLRIPRGSMNFLLGENGSGKSTLLKCLAGHQLWQGGEVLRTGLSRAKDRADFNRGLHLISEDIQPPLLPLRDLADLYKTLYGTFDAGLFERLIGLGHLDLSRDLQSVSRGQKIQGLLALTLATHPETLLIDEATAVLDPFIRNRLVLEIEQANQKFGTTVVIATNIATELKGLKGHVYIMHSGKLALDADVDEAGRGFAKVRVTAEHLGSVDKNLFSFLEKNADGSYVFVGRRDSLSQLTAQHEEDRRTLSIDELFIFFSDRRAA